MSKFRTSVVLVSSALLLVSLATRSADAGTMTFAEITGGLSGTPIFCDVSLDGTLVNAATGDQTGIRAGDREANDEWGRNDSTSLVANATPAGNSISLNSNSLDGAGNDAPDLKWTVSSGIDGSGAASLSANKVYDVFVTYMTHSGLTSWGGVMSNESDFTPSSSFSSPGTGYRITSVGTGVTDWYRQELSFQVTTDGAGAATLYIGQGNNDNECMIDGVIFQTVPEPSTLALLACGALGLLAYAWRKRR